MRSPDASPLTPPVLGTPSKPFLDTSSNNPEGMFTVKNVRLIIAALALAAGVFSNLPGHKGNENYGCNSSQDDDALGKKEGESCRSDKNCDNSGCQELICSSGVCTHQRYTPIGTQAPRQDVGNCNITFCDGMGGTFKEYQNPYYDAPETPIGEECFRWMCSGKNGEEGFPYQEYKDTNTPCCGYEGMCNGYGACNKTCTKKNIEPNCTSDKDCNHADSTCIDFVCYNSVCRPTFVPYGSLIPPFTEDPGDCRRDVCDGNGKLINAIDTSDTPIEWTDVPCIRFACDANGNPYQYVDTTNIPFEKPNDCYSEHCGVKGYYKLELPEGTPCININGDPNVCDAFGNCLF